MKKSSKGNCSAIIYKITTIVAIILALCFVDWHSLSGDFSVTKILILCGVAFLVQALKFLRIYFVVLEDMPPISMAIRLYAKTTLVSMLLPFKTGELYKMYAYGYKLGRGFSRGVICVIIDKFFDAVILSIVFILGFNADGSKIAILAGLICFIVAVLAYYYFFEPTYRYLNRFFMIRGGGKKSLAALRALEKAKNLYDNVREMVYGRQLVCLGLSALAWLIEGVGFFIVVTSLRYDEYVTYITESFFGVGNSFLAIYITCCAAVSIVSICVAYTIRLIRGGEEDKK